jgi:hypothetical protein
MIHIFRIVDTLFYDVLHSICITFLTGSTLERGRAEPSGAERGRGARVVEHDFAWTSMPERGQAWLSDVKMSICMSSAAW